MGSKIEPRCRICDLPAVVEEVPAEAGTYMIRGCACLGPFRAQGPFWMAASLLRGFHPEKFRRLSEYLQRESRRGEMPMVTLDNWQALAANLG